jgi:serine/threonine-protein phosphatase 6 regulatory ankyrin repeat subunit B
VFNSLLNAKADPLIVDEDGVTTLMSAASQGHAELCKIIIGTGVSVNSIAKSGGTAIMFAAGGGHNDTIKLLLENKADVNVVVKGTPEYIEQVGKAILEGKEDVEPHKDGVTALMVAAQGGYLKATEMLIDAGAVVDVKDEEEMSPLLNAVKGNHGEVAKLLLKNGANPNDFYVDDKQKTHNLLMDSIVVNNTEFSIMLIEKGANVSYTDDAGVTPLTQAAYLGQLSVVKALIQNNADVSAANNEGINSVIAASSEGFDEVLEVLLSTKKADVNSKDKDGTNALMAASIRGHKTVVDRLIKHGADVNAQNVDGHSALMFAYNGKSQVETLLNKYGDVYAKDENTTRIIRDALQTHVDVLTSLLQNGAKADLKDKEGHTATDFDFKPPASKIPVEGSITPGSDEL